MVGAAGLEPACTGLSSRRSAPGISRSLLPIELRPRTQRSLVRDIRGAQASIGRKAAMRDESRQETTIGFDGSAHGRLNGGQTATRASLSSCRRGVREARTVPKVCLTRSHCRLARDAVQETKDQANPINSVSALRTPAKRSMQQWGAGPSGNTVTCDAPRCLGISKVTIPLSSADVFLPRIYPTALQYIVGQFGIEVPDFFT
jgi:hypothetical protein